MSGIVLTIVFVGSVVGMIITAAVLGALIWCRRQERREMLARLAERIIEIDGTREK